MWHVSCFRNDPDVPTTSDDDGGYKYVAQSESSSAAEAKEEEVGSSNGDQERNFKDGGWFLQVQKASLSYLLHPDLFVICTLVNLDIKCAIWTGCSVFFRVQQS